MNEHAKPHRAATYQDVLDAPEHMVAEIVRGRLHLHRRPAPRHAYAVSAALGVIISSFDKAAPRHWWILREPEVHLGADVLVPNICGWRRERMPQLPENHVGLAPDWVCEVVSTETRPLDLTDKRDSYGANGVPWLWLIDPDARVLEAFALRDGRWRLIAALRDGAEVRVPPFEAIAFPLADLWAD